MKLFFKAMETKSGSPSQIVKKLKIVFHCLSDSNTRELSRSSSTSYEEPLLQRMSGGTGSVSKITCNNHQQNFRTEVLK